MNSSNLIAYLLKITLTLTLLGAASSVVAAPFTIVKDAITYDVRTDGLYTYEESSSVKINDAQGVALLGQVPVSFSDSLQKLDVIEAYTSTTDGKRIDVAPDKIIVQQLPASANAPTFSDHKLKIIIFPQVEIGSTLNMRIRREQLKPELPGVFSMQEVFAKTAEYENAELTLRTAAGIDLKIDSNGLTGGEVKGAGAGREWHWTLSKQAATLAEPGSVGMEDVSPFVAATSLKNYDDFARAYMIGATPAAKVTPAVQQQANKITQGIENRRAQAEAIYRWVSANIRYVAIFMNVGGFVPHDADAILQARYGDCKDHVVLLEALLAAKGISSSPVLLNGTNDYSLPKVAVLSAFNHAMTYLPEFQLFVDSTSGYARFGVLPDSSTGKTVLVPSGGDGKSALMKTPLLGNQTDKISVKTTATIATDGTVTGKNSVTATGAYDLAHRVILDALPKPQLPQIANTLLARSGQNGTADFQFEDAHDLTQWFSYESDFNLPGRITLPGPGAFNDNLGIGTPIGIASLVAGAALPNRALAFACSGGAREEVTVLTLPSNLKISTLPKATKFDSRIGSYESSYIQAENLITVKRKLELLFTNPTCNSDDYTEIKKLAATVLQDLRAQYLYK
ncbi:MAG: DUF3857 domain-containing transglutaminase family protein [Steroidobacteraceae bacterium]